jgi:hypothetical protein
MNEVYSNIRNSYQEYLYELYPANRDLWWEPTDEEVDEVPRIDELREKYNGGHALKHKFE